VHIAQQRSDDKLREIYAIRMWADAQRDGRSAEYGWRP